MSLTHPLSLSWPLSLNEKVWLQIGKLSQQTGKVSQQSGKVSQQSGKVSQQTGKFSQQTGKVSQQAGKVSQHPFAVKWQVTKIVKIWEEPHTFLNLADYTLLIIA